MEDAVQTGRLVVQTKIFPLYEVIDGNYRLSRKIKKPKPVTEYFKLQRRFRHLTEKDIALIQERVDREYDKLLGLCGIGPEE